MMVNKAFEAGEAASSGLVVIEAGALRKAVLYVEEKGYTRVTVAVDANTFKAGAEAFGDALTKTGIRVHYAVITPDGQGDVIADEASVIQLLLEAQHADAEAIVAFGAGTLHDIVRYSAYTLGIPFISVPTAASVDGFTSTGAPLILRGHKQTIHAIGPAAIFADLDVLMKAPKPMVAAGFGDMLGKYTSLFDWKFAHLAAGEPYMQEAADLTNHALQRCVDHVEAIARMDEEGMAILIQALIESGNAIQLFGQSHPASGSEHHLSHYWEMEYLRLGRKQLLHGAKVGVACIEISRLYHRLESEASILTERPSAATEGLKEGLKEADSVQAASAAVLETVSGNWTEISAEIRQIPDERMLTDLLKQVGGPTTPAELRIEPDLLERSLREAHQVRMNRYTLLRFYNETNAKLL